MHWHFSVLEFGERKMRAHVIDGYRGRGLAVRVPLCAAMHGKGFMAEYNQLTPELIAELENIVGGDNCLTGEDINEDYAHDEMPIYGTHMPDAVVLPANTDEVSAIMKLASANNIPVTVRGAGTGLVDGSTPLAGGIALCTMRMDKILEYDEKTCSCAYSRACACAIWRPMQSTMASCIRPIRVRKRGLSAETCPRMPAACEP